MRGPPIPVLHYPVAVLSIPLHNRTNHTEGGEQWGTTGTTTKLNISDPLEVGRFDFKNFFVNCAPGVSIILIYILKGLKELSAPKMKNCLDAKGVILYSKIAKNS